MMLSKSLLVGLLTLPFLSFAQSGTQTGNGYSLSSKEFSKDVALYRAKSFVVETLFGSGTELIQFEMDPLAAASSGEVTSLVYHCDKLKKEGLILGFFGDKWNASGVVYQAYAFKNLPSAKAIELLEKIEKSIADNTKYLNSDISSNNVTFKYDDLTFIINFGPATNIRVFWDDFDASWDGTAFKRTKRRLLKKLDQ